MKLPLELTSPRALGLLVLLAPLLLLYILKVRRQRLRVGSTWLWQQARRDLMARSPFKRLVVQLPLLVQAAGLIILALAAAGPTTKGRRLSGEHVAIIIDTSASMAAEDPASGKSRIALARAAAQQLVDSLAPGSDAMILDAGREARIALPPDRDTRRMGAVISAMKAREVEGDLGASIALATSRLTQVGGSRHIAVVTDGNLARPAPLSATAVPIDLVRVGAPIDNAAIVRVDVRGGRDPVLGREQVQAFLLVANYGRAARELYVTMRQRNASDTLASRRISVAPGDKVPVVLTFEPTEGDRGTGLLFDISPHDALEVDDHAFGRIPEGNKLPVVLASRAERSPWLLRALASDPDAEVRAGKLAEVLAAAKVPDDALVVVDGACPAAPPGGDLLIVNPPAGDCFEATVGAKIDKPIITSWESADDRLRFLTLDGVFVSAAHALETLSKRQALIRSDQGVIGCNVSTSSRSITLLGFDVGDSNWPLQASFVLFVRNVMELARRHRSRSLSGPATTGAPLRLLLPTAVRRVTVSAPDGSERELPARGGLGVVPEIAQSGLYRAEWQAPRPGGFWLPVNLASEAESDLRKQPENTAGRDAEVPVSAARVESHRRWGWLGALAALLLIVFDVWLLTRKRRPLALGKSSRPRPPAATTTESQQ